MSVWDVCGGATLKMGVGVGVGVGDDCDVSVWDVCGSAAAAGLLEEVEVAEVGIGGSGGVGVLEASAGPKATA